MTQIQTVLKSFNPIEKKKELVARFGHVNPTHPLTLEEILSHLDSKSYNGNYDRKFAQEIFEESCGLNRKASLDEFFQKYIDLRNTIVVQTRKQICRGEQLNQKYNSSLFENNQSERRNNLYQIEVKAAFLERVYGERPDCYVTLKGDNQHKTTQNSNSRQPVFDESFDMTLARDQKLQIILIDNDFKVGSIFYNHANMKNGEVRKEKSTLFLNGSPTVSWVTFNIKAIKVSDLEDVDLLKDQIQQNQDIIDDNIAALNKLLAFEIDGPIKPSQKAPARRQTLEDRLGNWCMDRSGCCKSFSKIFVVFTLLMIIVETLGSIIYPSLQLVILLSIVGMAVTAELTRLRFKVGMHLVIYSQILQLIVLFWGDSCGQPWLQKMSGWCRVYVLMKSGLFGVYVFFYWLCAIRFDQFRKQLGYQKRG